SRTRPRSRSEPTRGSAPRATAGKTRVARSRAPAVCCRERSRGTGEARNRSETPPPTSDSPGDVFVDLEPARPGAFDRRAPAPHLPFVAVCLGGAQPRQGVEELLMQGDLLGPDLGTM